jgi:hypothetical protein
MRQITLGIKEDMSDFCQHLSCLLSKAIAKKVCADGCINSVILNEWHENMDLDCTNTCPAVVGGDVLDMSDLQKKNLFTNDGKFWGMQKLLIKCAYIHDWQSCWWMEKIAIYKGKPLNVKLFSLMTASELPTKNLR